MLKSREYQVFSWSGSSLHFTLAKRNLFHVVQNHCITQNNDQQQKLSDLLQKCISDQQQNTSADSADIELLVTYYPKTNNLDVGLKTV